MIILSFINNILTVTIKIFVNYINRIIIDVVL